MTRPAEIECSESGFTWNTEVMPKLVAPLAADMAVAIQKGWCPWEEQGVYWQVQVVRLDHWGRPMPAEKEADVITSDQISDDPEEATYLAQNLAYQILARDDVVGCREAIWRDRECPADYSAYTWHHNWWSLFTAAPHEL